MVLLLLSYMTEKLVEVMKAQKLQSVMSNSNAYGKYNNRYVCQQLLYTDSFISFESLIQRYNMKVNIIKFNSCCTNFMMSWFYQILK